MSDGKQARLLLAASERDLTALRGMMDATVFADEIFGFHVQQAVEKLFKAWLALLGESYPATHNLARLLEMLTPHNVDTSRFDKLVEFTPYAVQFRYAPGDPGSIPVDRKTAVEGVQMLFEVVRRRSDDTETP